jgi:hypothetical protein
MGALVDKAAEGAGEATACAPGDTASITGGVLKDAELVRD